MLPSPWRSEKKLEVANLQSHGGPLDHQLHVEANQQPLGISLVTKRCYHEILRVLGPACQNSGQRIKHVSSGVTGGEGRGTQGHPTINEGCPLGICRGHLTKSQCSGRNCTLKPPTPKLNLPKKSSLGVRLPEERAYHRA